MHKINSILNDYQISVITDPVRHGKYLFSEPIKGILRKIKHFIFPLPHYMESEYRGHPAVTRSLVEGLYKIRCKSNYNPRNLKDLSENVVLLSGVSALKQMIQFKKNGLIKKLLVGPNLIEMPTDYDSLVSDSSIDACIVNSEWTKILYQEDCPEIKDRLVIWPAGVDTHYWCVPSEMRKQKKVIFYEKQRKGRVGPIEPYIEWVKEQGYEVVVIKAGEYSLEEFRCHLLTSQIMVGFVRDESQGLAWAEAWSSDVPTFIWRNNSINYRNKEIQSSTAPYLEKNTGMFFDNIENFKSIFTDWMMGKLIFHPREWVIDNMSDEFCAKKILQIVDSIK